MKCGLLGRRLSHSYSPQIHAMLGDYSYTLFEKEPDELESFLRSGTWDGLNVTAPYKKAVIPYLDELSPIAARLGAVNTIVRRNGRLIGHNTDYYGFQMLMDNVPVPVTGKNVLVLGSGGASNTVSAVLADRGAKVIIVSRNGENNYSNLHLHADACLIVNTTPVGMYPDTGISPIPELYNERSFPELQAVVDIVYNPKRTQLILDAEKHPEICTAGGLLMLVAQAKEASEWFSGQKISDDVIQPIISNLERQLRNIVLIGMPGAGKTTIGKLLAERTRLQFVDSDEAIVRRAGKSIPEIFVLDGESAFRQLETEVLGDFGKQSGYVIATGGGCVTRPENYNLLHQNGTIFWIRRETDILPTDGRPLSMSGNLETMYRIRRPLYEQFQDRCIENNSTPADAVDKILQLLEVQP